MFRSISSRFHQDSPSRRPRTHRPDLDDLEARSAPSLVGGLFADFRATEWAEAPRIEPYVFFEWSSDFEVTSDLNRRVLDEAQGHLGLQVGDGQCGTLADAALKAAGAKSFDELGPTGPDADYVWGDLVATLTPANHPTGDIMPGDVIQFRDVAFFKETVDVNGNWWWETSRFPHHTAIVESVDGHSVTILHQNVNGELFVQEATLDLDGMTQGTMWVYRPIPA